MMTSLSSVLVDMAEKGAVKMGKITDMKSVIQVVVYLLDFISAVWVFNLDLPDILISSLPFFTLNAANISVSRRETVLPR